MADNQIDMYEQRKMLKALEQVPPVHRFFHNTFFRTTVKHTTPTVELDIYKGKRRVAAYVNPIKSGRVVEREGFETFTTRPAYTKEKMAVTPKDTQLRVIGTNAYTEQNPQQIADMIMGDNLRALDERLIRREEIMCAQALLDGKVIVKGDGYDAQVNFGYTAGNAVENNIKTLSGTDTWNNPNSKPLEDLDKWRMEIVQRCGIQPNRCIVSSNVGWILLKHPEIKEMLDIQRMNIGSMEPEALPEGVSYYGRLLLPSGEVRLYSYNEWFTDPDTGNDIPLVPNGKVLLGSTEARCEFHYGMIQNMDSLRALPRWPKTWTELDGSARWVQLESAPMPNLFQVGAFTVANVL